MSQTEPPSTRYCSRRKDSRSLIARIGFGIARGAFAHVRETIDPARSNGGAFLGLNGIVIKSHGGTTVEGFAAAIEIGHGMARSNIVDMINRDLADYRAAHNAAAGDVAAKTGAM